MAVWVPDGGRDDLDQLVQDLVDLFAVAESRLTGALATHLRAGLEAGEVNPARALRLGELTAEAQRVARWLSQTSPEVLDRILDTAAQRGVDAAVAELSALVGATRATATTTAVAGPAGTLVAPTSAAAVVMRADLSNALADVTRRVLRYPDDVYRRAVALSASDVTLGLASTGTAQLRAWNALLGQGVTGFRDVRGRNWNLATYVEMATRSATRRAFDDAKVGAMRANGVDLVSIVVGSGACEKCARWAGKILRTDAGPTGRVKVRHATEDRDITVTVAGTIDQAKAAHWRHPNCFPAWVPVGSPTGVAAADSRWFEGELVIIHTASGRELSVTPNHPVLTPHGWVAAGTLDESDDLIRYDGPIEDVPVGAPDHERGVAPIGEVYEALRKSRFVSPVLVPGAAEQFHGDGSLDSEVDVVLADRLLRHDGQPARLEQTSEGEFLVGGVRLPSLLSGGAPLEVVDASGHAPHSLVSSAREAETVLLAGLLHAHAHGIGGASGETGGVEQPGHSAPADAELGGDTRLTLAGAVALDDLGLTSGASRLSDGESGDAGLAHDRVAGDAKTARDLLDGLSGLVSADQVVQVERRRQWSGHVYNLQTGGGWYLASDYIVHNCRCATVAYLPGLSVIADVTTYDPDAEAARVKLRDLEVRVRRAKADAASALDDDTRRAANAKVRDLQARIRAHVADTGLMRQRNREQPNLGNVAI